MLVSTTEFKNNLGKYLALALQDELVRRANLHTVKHASKFIAQNMLCRV
jgi:hypothetical protein